MRVLIAKTLWFIKPERRWLQFSTRAMLLAITLLCVCLADYASPVRKLERQLSDPDEAVRWLAELRLGFMGPEARSATNSLLTRAKDDTSSSNRFIAVWAVSRVSGRADLLKPFLTDDDVNVSLAAAEGLLWMGHEPREIVPTLLELSLSGITSPEVDAIFQGLGRAQSAMVVPLLVDSMWSAEEVDRRDEGNPASSALQNVPVPEPTVVPALIARLKSNRPEVVKAAAEQLLRLGKAAKDALPALRARLHDPNPACAAACAAAVGAIDPDDPNFLDVLLESLRSEDFALSQDVAAYLYMLGPDAAGSADELAALFSDRDVAFLSASHANVLKRLGPSMVSALDRKLQGSLKHRDLGAAKRTVPWLGFIGPPTAPAVPTLIEALDSADLRICAVHALGSIGKSAFPAIGHLLQYIDSEDRQLQYAAIAALEKIGAADEAARARLRPLLASDDERARMSAARALAASGEPADRLLPTLIELARDRNYNYGAQMRGESYSVARDIIAPLGPQAVRGLVHALHDNNSDIRRVGAEALEAIGALAKAAVPRLIELLDDEQVWDAAAEALGGIGADAHAAVPKLVEDLKALRQPPKPGDFNSNGNDRFPEDEGGYDPSDYVPRLHALGGIGIEARAALVEVLRLADSEDDIISCEAVFTLARIAPNDPSLIPRMRRILAEWERESATPNMFLELATAPRKQFADAVWGLGPHAEALAPDLYRIMATTPLANPELRCYGAFALARFESHRDAAVAYLEQVVNSSFPTSFDTVNLAYQLLQRIKGVEVNNEWLMTPLGIGP